MNILKPFSYLVPYYRFPSEHTVFSLSGAEAKVLAEVPLIEELPKGRMSVRSGPRNFSWMQGMVVNQGDLGFIKKLL